MINKKEMKHLSIKIKEKFESSGEWNQNLKLKKLFIQN